MEIIGGGRKGTKGNDGNEGGNEHFEQKDAKGAKLWIEGWWKVDWRTYRESTKGRKREMRKQSVPTGAHNLVGISVLRVFAIRLNEDVQVVNRWEQG